MELPIATGWYEDASKPIAAQECSNFIPQIPQTNAFAKAYLVGTPGISLRSTAGTSANRGVRVMSGIPYAVNGNTLYRENNDGTTTGLGTIVGSGQVSMADNGTQLCIVVPESTGYIYSVSGGLQTITDTDFTTTLGPSEQVVFKDGFFIHFNSSSSAGTGVIYFISNLNNGLAYDALDFGSAEIDPDRISGIHVNRNILYIGGEITIEPVQNVGGSGFPFQRIPGAVIQKGVRSKFSLVDYDNAFAFVGGGENESPAVWRASGSSVQKLSTSAIDNELNKLTSTQLDRVFSTVYADGTGYFLNIHTPTRTFSYDSLASQLGGKSVWHERKSIDLFDQETIWRVNGIVEAYGKLIVADNQSGNIGELDLEVYSEYGTSTISTVSTTPFHNQGNRVTVAEMELTCESGVGNIVAPGDDPVVRRQFSDDGGFTFSNWTTRRLGKQGEYNTRQIWRREGQFSRYRINRFSMSDPVKRVIAKLEGEVL
jgi:hypothetical protein